MERPIPPFQGRTGEDQYIDESDTEYDERMLAQYGTKYMNGKPVEQKAEPEVPVFTSPQNEIAKPKAKRAPRKAAVKVVPVAKEPEPEPEEDEDEEYFDLDGSERAGKLLLKIASIVGAVVLLLLAVWVAWFIGYNGGWNDRVALNCADIGGEMHDGLCIEPGGILLDESR